MSDKFNAIVINKDDDGYGAALSQVAIDDFPEGDVIIDVDYSTVNFKDGLALTGASPIARSFPMVGGIDLAGTVASSDSDKFKAGDKVLINGYGLSESRWGGYAQKVRVTSDLIVALPDAFTTKQAMAIGTAGYTAMLCVLALEDGGVTPDSGPVLVTGAAGGVGSVAIALLAKLGYEVIASTGRASEADYLKGLGASDIIDRETLSGEGRPLGRETWAGAVDSVGSKTLANVLAQIKYGGTVAACGLAQGMDLPSTVMPFILRGVTLAGVDSVMAPMAKRERAWARLATDLDVAKLDAMTDEVPMSEVIDRAPAILAGQIRGRLVVDVNA